MTEPSRDILFKVVRMVQDMLSEQDRLAVTPEMIDRNIDMVLAMMPSWGASLDREAARAELIRRLSTWIGADTTLVSDEGHVAWLTAGRKADWRYWQRYRDWMEERLSVNAVDSLDLSTDTVLGQLEDPRRSGPWDRRGLVVGHVQSGKTGHYTGLICKAADAGYKIIIVLAGLHNNLRSQTQVRLEEGFLGFETGQNRDVLVPVGVGDRDSDPAIRPNNATWRGERGDFNTAFARSLGITPEQRPWLFVVKKNRTVLDRLLGWVRNHVANTSESGRPIVTHLPLLLIDDEADHASVDTGDQAFDGDGNPDPDHQPTAINRLVRRLLHTFQRSAYVGYTATPFANIFIHEKGETPENGPDLFPAAFIVNLSAPSNYVGPVRIFGRETEDGRREGLPLIRTFFDTSTEDERGGWMPPRHRNGHVPLFEGRPPPSLEEAIDAFILACAARAVRGQGRQHASMLVHVTRFNTCQDHVHRQVEAVVRHRRQRLLRRIGSADVLARLRRLWESDHLPTSSAFAEHGGNWDPPELPEWKELETLLPDVVADIQVRKINGTARDALDYTDRATTGLKVIAIGGDKLARGLTLEGLCVSYFLRASRMYDTLMQMGRWFGYRPGYLDLCRLYTTPDLDEWFGHIAEASEELREEFEFMAAAGATPREYGLKVQSHPVLMVTSRLKMRTARSLMLSFSGQIVETVALFRDKHILAENLAAAQRLLQRQAPPHAVSGRRNSGEDRGPAQRYLWQGVPAADVIEFLRSYRTHPDAHKVNSPLLAQFVESMSGAGELTHWHVALIGGGEGSPAAVLPGLTVRRIRRAEKGSHPDRYSIGRVLSPRDEAIDLDQRAWAVALEKTREAWRADPARREDQAPPNLPAGPAIRQVRGFGADGVPAHPERGVMFLYPLEPLETNGFASDTPTVMALAISFPASDAGRKVEYMVNNVLWQEWEREYGAAD